jgi:ketosteroid isomerase-like protein
MTGISREPVAIAREFIDAMSEKDFPRLSALLSSDVVLEFPFPLIEGEGQTGSRRLRGDDVRRSVEASLRNMETISFVNMVWRSTSEGDVILQAEGECTFAGGQAYRNSYIFLFEIRQGKIARWWEYLNPVVSARAMGKPLETIP